ncbi:SAVED domain-containing protein [Oceaniovalibus sp. ACAM 378]|uniref:SAVED domain-containing protein n=1 Tax=Oceaniovalibus sp. ACAM 378 TaxID=2599923 RepID=UPI0011D3A3B1|nr:SAVED domain-containing protein [Oceaniovalibus sp. ACAM 378]TYB83590.1 SAVED domain-containing protein [Oceaniovalibus sp. ACAM 378]
MSSTSIPAKTQTQLWALAAGRCEFAGCNKLLIGDLIAGKQDGKFGFIAHIVADSESGPRGDKIRSPLLARDIDNLMLMCPIHHKEIDVDHANDYPEISLLAMKREHENRIESVTDMDADRAAHVLRFAATIGQMDSLISTKAIFAAMPPDRHPAERRTIDIELNSEIKDGEPDFWEMQSKNLNRQFKRKVKERIEQNEILQLSVFALAPQPLLIELGTLLGDIMPVSVHQKYREPSTWKWQLQQPSINFEVDEYSGPKDVPIGLKLAISATVDDERIRSVLGKEAAIWSITAKGPHNDILRRQEDLAIYKTHLRRLLDRIKYHHGEGATINVFPVLPASVAVETGRARMPKADLPLMIYDQMSGKGFVQTIRIIT